MSSFDRRSFLIMTAALAGCGFTPSYGPGGGAVTLQNRILFDEPSSRDTYLMVRQLETRLGRAQVPVYGLSLSVSTNERSMAKSVSGRTNRFDVVGKATYALRDLETNEVVTSGKVDNFTGYSASGSTVSTLAAETDAYERLMTILADDIATRLLAFAASAT